MKEVDDLELIFGEMSNFAEQEQSDLFENVKSSSLELKNIQNNINILNEDINKLEDDLKTPGSILDEYSNIEYEIEQIQESIQKIKNENASIFENISIMEDKISELREQQSNLKPQLTESMKNSGLKKLENAKFKVVYVAATIRETFDKDKFKKKYPVLYSQFVKTSDVSEYIKISEVK